MTPHQNKPRFRYDFPLTSMISLAAVSDGGYRRNTVAIYDDGYQNKLRFCNDFPLTSMISPAAVSDGGYRRNTVAIYDDGYR